MKICMVGTGYVGLVSGACFAETGNEVVCADIDGDKIRRLEAGESIIFEPGLDAMVERNAGDQRLSFASDVAAAVAQAEAVFVAVGTPPRSDGGADLRAVDAVAEMVAASVTGPTVLVLKSTVPVGTNARVRRIVKDAAHPVHVVSNPEFLKEGSAIDDFMRPDRIVIGCDEDDELARNVMGRLYHPVSLSGERIIWMDPASAELTKYVANTMLAMRISFMNEVAALCDKVGADIHSVRRGVGSDARIGPKFLYAGPGFGGSCLHGHETILFGTGDRWRLVRLDAIFDEQSTTPEDTVVPLEDARVLAWQPGFRTTTMAECKLLTRRPYEGELLAVRTKMGRRVRCTPDHPFVVVDPSTGTHCTKLARDLDAGDWLPLALGGVEQRETVPLDVLDALPLMGIAESEVIVRLDDQDQAALREMGHDRIYEALSHARGRERVYDILRSGALRLDEARALGLPLRRATLGTARNGTYIPRAFERDEAFWRVVGLYLAEGHRTVDGRRHRLYWSFHPTAEPELIDEVAGYFTRLGVRCDVRRATTAMKVSVSSRLLGCLFTEVLRLGGDCYSHRIPDAAWAATAKQQMTLLSGLWQGDGSWSLVAGGPSVVLEYGTVSRALADGMVRLLAGLGVVARVKVARMTKSTRDTYFLVIAGADQVERMVELAKPAARDTILWSIGQQKKRIAPTGYRRLADGLAAVRITSIEAEPFQGYVYSLEVPETHTFVTSGSLVTHNCFPKDIKALANTANEHGMEIELAAATDRVNLRQKAVLARKLKQHFDGDLRGRKVCVWGLAFKPRTDDVRESPALQLIDTLLSEGASVRAHDPEAMDNVAAMYGERVTLADDAYEAAEGCDALVLVTEWRQYQNPDFKRLQKLLAQPVLVDGRNIWTRYGLRKLGFTYLGIGVRGS